MKERARESKRAGHDLAREQDRQTDGQTERKTSDVGKHRWTTMGRQH